jgi:heptaprenyl diphosphate synthase
MKTKTIARFSLLIALALVLGYVELLIPITPTIPGIKLGLANTVLLYAVYMTSPAEAAILMLCKVALSGFLFGGGFSSILYSLAGGVFSLLVMSLLVRIPRVGVIGVSACGAIAHNIGQIAVASWLLGAGAVWAYFPILLVSGLIMGPITGMIAQMVFVALQKNQMDFFVRPRYFRESRKTDLLIILCMILVSGGSWLAMSARRAARRQGEAVSATETTETSFIETELETEKTSIVETELETEESSIAETELGTEESSIAETELGTEESSIAETELGTQADSVTYYLEIIQNNRLLYIIPTTSYGTYTLENAAVGGTNTFVIDQDGVHVDEASCPDKICVSQGVITIDSYLPICCLPNYLVMQIITSSEIPDGFDLMEQNYSSIRE